MKRIISLMLVVTGLLLTSACSSDTEPCTVTTNLPQLYAAGKDTTVVEKTTSCTKVTRNFTNCKGEPDTYYTYLPGVETEKVHRIKKQGVPVSTEYLRKMFENECVMVTGVSTTTQVNKKSASDGSSFFHTPFFPDWFWKLLRFLLALGLIGLVLLGLIGLLRLLWNFATAHMHPYSFGSHYAYSDTEHRHDGHREEHRTDAPQNTTHEDITVPEGCIYIGPKTPGEYRSVTVTLNEGPQPPTGQPKS